MKKYKSFGMIKKIELLLKQTEQLFNQALEARDKAAQIPHNYETFKLAALKYEETAKSTEEILKILDKSNVEGHIQGKAYVNHYRFEKYDCLYPIYFKNQEYEKALEVANNASEYILKALNIVEEGLPLMKKKSYITILKERQLIWKLFLIETEIKKIEPKARLEANERRYLNAFDLYSQILRYSEDAHKYVIENKSIPPNFTRVTKGNYFANHVNVAKMFLGMLLTKNKDISKDINLQIELLKQFIKAYHFGERAYSVNPVNDIYKNGSIEIKNAICNILSQTKHNWFDFILELGESKTLLVCMKKVDFRLYKSINSDEAKEIREGVLSNIYILENEKYSMQGTCFHLKNVGLITCSHCIKDNSIIFSAKDISKKHKIKIIKRHKTIDLVIIEAPHLKLNNGLDIGNSDKVLNQDLVYIAGFPNYRKGDTGIFSTSEIVGFRTISTIKRLLLKDVIIGGNSGGPILDQKGAVIGIAATGPDNTQEGRNTEMSSAISINSLQYLIK
jgi:tetratricopeptide (TPR) repeat protein